jgi:hypothetical protein
MTNKQEKTVHNLLVFADNFQFHLQDQLEDCDYAENWNDSLLTRLFAYGDKVVGIGTMRDLDCEVTLEIYDKPMESQLMHQDPDMEDADHVVQCNIEIPSGKLMITGCITDPEDTIKIDVTPGHYGVRVFWSNLEKTDELGFEGDDHYLVQLWPDTYFDDVILKYWRQLIFLMSTPNN